MALTKDELQNVISAVLSSLQTNSRTIEQLTMVTSLSDSDCFEINGGKKVPYKVLRDLIDSLFSSEHDNIATIINNCSLKSANVTVTENTATLTISSIGKTISTSIPIVTETHAGMMTAADKAAIGQMKHAVDDAQSKAGNALGDAIIAIQKAEEAAEAAASLRGSIGMPGGIAPVGSDGKIPAEFLPKSSASGGDGSGCECGDLTDKVTELERAVWPLELTVQTSLSLIKVGVPTPVRFTFSAKRRGVDVSSSTVFGVNRFTLRKGVTTYEEIFHDSVGLGEIVPVTAHYEGITTETSVTIRGTHPSYFGVVPADWGLGDEAVKALTELLVGSRSTTRTGISIDNGRIVMAYPADFGALTSIKDGNGYEVLSSYTRSELTVDGINYLCYMLTEPVTAEGVKQVFS